MLERHSRNLGSCSHSPRMNPATTQAASKAKRVLFIKEGVVFNQIYRGEMGDDEMYRKISDTLTMLATGGERT